MPSPRRKLPSMTALPVFEAAARSLSFTKAANELCVTQAAVSRQIASLESSMGVKLFERSHRKITLTPAGQQLQNATTIALDIIENSSRKIQSSYYRKASVTIAADASMAYRWLLPNFEKFHRQHPDIPVNISTCEHEEDCLKPDVDITLLYGNGHWPGFHAKRIINEVVFPVCHPDYLQHHPITSLADLVEHELLDLVGERWDWVGWQQWLLAMDIPIKKPLKTTIFNSFPLLTEATLQGSGIGLGWDKLVDDLLANGKLVRPFTAALTTDRGYYILRRSNERMSERATVFYDWIEDMLS